MRQIMGRSEVLILLVSIWVTLLSNTGYWRVVADSGPTGSLPSSIYFVSVALLSIGLVFLVLLALAVAPAVRVILMLALIVSASAGYFTSNYGMLFDTGMLVNVMETNSGEAFELISTSLLLNIVVLGVIPAIFVWRYPLVRRRFTVATIHRSIAIIIALGLISSPFFLSQKEVFSLVRNHRELVHMIAPVNVVLATYRSTQDRLEAPVEFRSVALDAVRVQQSTADDLPFVHVIIVGETARAANFSLNDYPRITNPKLQQQNITFLQADSCGTATATSLPCMFSLQNRVEFDREASKNEDNLLDIAARSGYKVYWVDNGNGCKGVCARVDSRDVHLSNVDGICPDGQCYDEILVHELGTLLSQVTEDTLIVLHQLGSHGPAYYRRYPENFRVFLPDCRSDNFGDCSKESITNSYDNTIVYTDHVISAAIDTLAAHAQDLNSSLIYMSDHGESLGEHDLYLHGMPYRFAPNEQTQIPMIAWTNVTADQQLGVPSNCSGQLQPLAFSHDNLFHTELGLLGIASDVYSPAKDIYSACRELAKTLPHLSPSGSGVSVAYGKTPTKAQYQL